MREWGWRMICIFQEGNIDNPFKDVQEVPHWTTPRNVLENWINSTYGEGFKAGTLSREEIAYQYFFIHPIFGTRFRAWEAPVGGTDWCDNAINNYRLSLCRMFEVPETFRISDEKFFLLQREYSDQHIVMRAAPSEEDLL